MELSRRAVLAGLCLTPAATLMAEPKRVIYGLINPGFAKMGETRFIPEHTPKIDTSRIETDLLKFELKDSRVGNAWPNRDFFFRYFVVVINDEIIENCQEANVKEGWAMYNYDPKTGMSMGTRGAKIQILFKSKWHRNKCYYYLNKDKQTVHAPGIQYYDSNTRIRRILEDKYSPK